MMWWVPPPAVLLTTIGDVKPAPVALGRQRPEYKSIGASAQPFVQCLERIDSLALDPVALGLPAALLAIPDTAQRCVGRLIAALCKCAPARQPAGPMQAVLFSSAPLAIGSLRTLLRATQESEWQATFSPLTGSVSAQTGR